MEVYLNAYISNDDTESKEYLGLIAGYVKANLEFKSVYIEGDIMSNSNYVGVIGLL